MQMIPVSKLKMDMTLYPRGRLATDSQRVAQYADARRAGATFPAILVCQDTMRVVDGFHRVESLIKVEGPDAKIKAILKKYTTDAQFLHECSLANSTHGQPLTNYDRRHVLILAEKVGLSFESACQALQITPKFGTRLVEERTAVSINMETKIPLKAAVSHLRGRRLTGEQEEAQKRVGGYKLSQLLDDLLLRFNTPGFVPDHPSDKVLMRIQRVIHVLENYMKGEKAA